MLKRGDSVDDVIRNVSKSGDEIAEAGTKADWVTTPQGRTISGSTFDEMIALELKWNFGSFDDVVESQAYHYGKHAAPNRKTFAQYTDDALDVFSEYANSTYSKSHTLNNGIKGMKIDLPDGRGGYFTNDGQIVTFWYD